MEPSITFVAMLVEGHPRIIPVKFGPNPKMDFRENQSIQENVDI